MKSINDKSGINNSSLDTNESSFIGPLVDRIINDIVSETKKPSNRKKLMHHFINPVLQDINDKYFFYYIVIVILLIIIVILLSLLLMKEYSTNNNSSNTSNIYPINV